MYPVKTTLLDTVTPLVSVIVLPLAATVKLLVTQDLLTSIIPTESPVEGFEGSVMVKAPPVVLAVNKSPAEAVKLAVLLA